MVVVHTSNHFFLFMKSRNVYFFVVAIIVILFFGWLLNRNVNSGKIDESMVNELVGRYKLNETQDMIISKDMEIKELKRINKELYDSIKTVKNLKEAIKVKYVTKLKLDTMYVSESVAVKDSIYEFNVKSDSIDYTLDIKASDVKWYKLNLSVKDSLMLVTRSSGEFNKTNVTHSKNTEITDVIVFTPKESIGKRISKRFYVGVGVGAGYGFFSHKPDVYVGVTAGIKF